MNEESDHPFSWEVPRPALRLWLTLTLGALGTVLLPISEDGSSLLGSGVQGLTAPVWMGMALLCVWWLHRAEGVRASRRFWSLVAAALALTLFTLRPIGAQVDGRISHVGLSLMSLSLLCAGVMISEPAHTRRSPLQWAESLVRGSAIVLTAPMLLFASRPTRIAQPSRWLDVLARLILGLCPFMLPLLIVLPVSLGRLGHHGLASACFSYVIWAWLGGGLLLLLSPWPESPHVPREGRFSRLRLLATLITIALVVIVPMKLVEPGATLILLHPLFLWATVGCALLLLRTLWRAVPGLGSRSIPVQIHGAISLVIVAGVGLSAALWFLWDVWDWRGTQVLAGEVLIVVIPACGLALAVILLPGLWNPFTPTLAALPRARGAHPIGLLFFLSLTLIPVAVYAKEPFLDLMSGRLFATRLQPWTNQFGWSGIAPPRMHGALLGFVIVSSLVMPCIAASRWMSGQPERLGGWAHAIPAAAIGLCLFFIITQPFAWLVIYCAALGLTPMRVFGLLCAVLGYLAVMNWTGLLFFLPQGGHRCQRFLHHQGYSWVTLHDAKLILHRLGSAAAHSVPPADEVETVPGASGSAENLIAFMRAMKRHRKRLRRGKEVE